MAELFTEQAQFAEDEKDECERLDLEAKPSWMSQELYDLLE